MWTQSFFNVFKGNAENPKEFKFGSEKAQQKQNGDKTECLRGLKQMCDQLCSNNSPYSFVLKIRRRDKLQY